MKQKLIWHTMAALGILFVLCIRPAFGITDYMFYSVNGDTTATSMIQGDSVAWGTNCDVGGSLIWEIWYDIDSDEVIDILEDIQIAILPVTDGSTGGGLPDINPTADGWYITPTMILGMAAGNYIFKAVNLTDSTSIQKPLICNEMISPPNTFSGHLIIYGHPTPDPVLVKNHWVQADGYNAGAQTWSAMTDDSGYFQINISSAGTGVNFRVSPPAIPGFTPPAEQTLSADGHIGGVDFVYIGPPFGKTDYMFYSVNGDTAATSMVQGDSVAWGVNCAGGGSLRWELWYDVNEDMVIDDHGDIQLFSFTATDGDIIGSDGLPDISPVPDGWYITPPIILGLAPGHYIFKAVNLDDPSEVQKPLVCSEMISPPNTLSGYLIVPGHPAPESAILNNRWVQTEGGAENQIWAAMTNDSGRFQINISNVGTGLTFQVSPPDIPGFVAPGSQFLLVSGHTENVNFEYIMPADSVWGFVLDQDSTVIMKPVRLWCNPLYGSGDKDVWTENGSYVFLFGPLEYGAWSIGWSEGLTPDYMLPSSFDFDNGIEHGIRHDFICPRADTVMYAKITENYQLPSHQYKIEVRQEPSGVETNAVSGTGANNIVILHISKLYSEGYRAGISIWDEDYPIPPGYIPDYNPGAIYHPGDTVPLNLQRGIIVSDTIKSDPADPPVNWDSAWIYINGDNDYSGTIDTNGVFTFYVQPGWYSYLGLYVPGHYSNPWGYSLGWLDHDTIGGLGFEVNKAHCRVHGTLTNVPLPLIQEVNIYAHGDSIHPNYGYFAPVDSATGAYEMLLCDGNWTIEAPNVFANRIPPAPVNLMISNVPDSVRIVNLEYTFNTSADGEDGNSLPTVFAVHQNYPNPFNPMTTIGYSIPTRSQVRIEIFNLLGQKVRTLVNEPKPAGSYKIEWNSNDESGRQVPTGVYLCRFRADNVVLTKKMLLIK